MHMDIKKLKKKKAAEPMWTAAFFFSGSTYICELVENPIKCYVYMTAICGMNRTLLFFDFLDSDCNSAERCRSPPYQSRKIVFNF